MRLWVDSVFFTVPYFMSVYIKAEMFDKQIIMYIFRLPIEETRFGF